MKVKVISIFILPILVSCSSFKTRGSNKTVSKQKYDLLLKRYTKLQKQAGISDVGNLKDELKGIRSEDRNLKRKYQLSHGMEMAESVDVFKNNNNSTSNKSDSNVIKAAIENSYQGTGDKKDIDEKIKLIKKIKDHIAKGDYIKAQELAKSISNHPIKQISIRAYYLQAEALFMQGEFALAMQFYEDIIGRFAFSGLVLKSLNRLIICSEKLKLTQKKKKYYSMLNDLFKAGSI